jgi:5-methylcytosine-specific restriction endonuclease McrA
MNGIIRTYNLTSVPALFAPAGNVTAVHRRYYDMSIVTQKHCLDCGETDLSKFGKNNAYKDGLMPRCRKCCNAHARQYYAENRETIAAKINERYHKNPEYLRNYAREREARLRQESPKHRAYNYQKAQQWIKNHPLRYGELMKASNSNRRARIVGAEGQYTTQEWLDLKTDYGNRCIYCGRKVEQPEADHVVPLKLGGANSIDNIAPACESCNSSKNATPLLVWMWRQLKKSGGRYAY